MWVKLLNQHHTKGYPIPLKSFFVSHAYTGSIIYSHSSRRSFSPVTFSPSNIFLSTTRQEPNPNSSVTMSPLSCREKGRGGRTKPNQTLGKFWRIQEAPARGLLPCIHIQSDLHELPRIQPPFFWIRDTNCIHAFSLKVIRREEKKEPWRTLHSTPQMTHTCTAPLKSATFSTSFQHNTPPGHPNVIPATLLWQYLHFFPP